MASVATMKAVRMHAFGGPEVLQYEDAPRPKAGAGEVLVKVYAAGINPVDWKTRTNLRGQRKASELPLILGWDISGVIEEVGSEVTQFKPGDAVYGMIRFPQFGSAYAEYATTPVSHITFKPATISHIEAAGVPLAALTAWQDLFEKVDLKAGQKVLVNGAAGGVGHFAVQFARVTGAHVLGTASASKLDFLRSLGVDEPIDYKATPFEQVAQEVDVFFDTVGDAAERSLAVIKPGGDYVTVVPGFTPLEKAAEKGIRMQSHLVYPNAGQLAEIARLIDAGKVRSVIETVLPLPEAAKAHELSQTGRTTGKIVLQVVDKG